VAVTPEPVSSPSGASYVTFSLEPVGPGAVMLWSRPGPPLRFTLRPRRDEPVAVPAVRSSQCARSLALPLLSIAFVFYLPPVLLLHLLLLALDLFL
jgi:hypothetical protein